MPPNNYINNKEFTAAIARWKEDWLKDNDTPIPHEVADCFLKLVKRYGTKGNFIGYTYNEDMQSEALVSCCKYAHNFDPSKSSNAFAYFTQIIYHSFLQFMNKEKKFAKFKFQTAKDSDERLAKHDYNDIMLGDYSGPTDPKEREERDRKIQEKIAAKSKPGRPKKKRMTKKVSEWLDINSGELPK
jgi:DNA-directed RNA polymerase specialized sigma subunit